MEDISGLVDLHGTQGDVPNQAYVSHEMFSVRDVTTYVYTWYKA